MENYVVALISFYDNKIDMFKIQAENEFEATKKAMVEKASEEYKQDELEWQQSDSYPTDMISFRDYLTNSDMDVEIVKVTSF